MNQQSQSKQSFFQKTIVAIVMVFIALDTVGLRNPHLHAAHEFLRMIKEGVKGAVLSAQESDADLGKFLPIETSTNRELTDKEIRDFVESGLNE